MPSHVICMYVHACIYLCGFIYVSMYGVSVRSASGRVHGYADGLVHDGGISNALAMEIL